MLIGQSEGRNLDLYLDSYTCFKDIAFRGILVAISSFVNLKLPYLSLSTHSDSIGSLSCHQARSNCTTLSSACIISTSLDVTLDATHTRSYVFARVLW